MQHVWHAACGMCFAVAQNWCRHFHNIARAISFGISINEGSTIASGSFLSQATLLLPLPLPLSASISIYLYVHSNLQYMYVDECVCVSVCVSLVVITHFLPFASASESTTSTATLGLGCQSCFFCLLASCNCYVWHGNRLDQFAVLRSYRMLSELWPENARHALLLLLLTWNANQKLNISTDLSLRAKSRNRTKGKTP